MKRMTLHLALDLYQQILVLAKAEHRSIQAQIRMLLEIALAAKKRNGS